MRITTGAFRGRVIDTVRDLSVRPATDRVRQTLFNMLSARMALEGAKVLDLFAGSGILGIEALSRGAARVTFVEISPRPAELLESALKNLGCLASADLRMMDAMDFLAVNREAYDLVFADPPYAFNLTSTIPRRVFSGGTVVPGGYLLIEHENTLSFEDTPEYRAGPRKRFGRTAVTFFQQRISPP